ELNIPLRVLEPVVSGGRLVDGLLKPLDGISDTLLEAVIITLCNLMLLGMKKIFLSMLTRNIR
ncbi:hypothetical protein DU195_23245, partial [Salmonella enterica subsp. enterica serovar Telhashomer]|nr:hypothetical protein [Salmonella enterica subsp. enterica serovar Telhashomer]ECA3525035.1 hypothetical protein [Salmonella enterica subsp. enterica serovar Telhashomer]